MSSELPLLIVGQGLAGSLLAWEWIRRGRPCRIADARDAHAASPVSAGILNPVTGKRIVKSWNVDALLPVARNTYDHLGEILGAPVFKPMPIVRLFQSEEEIKLWEERRGDPAYEGWLAQKYPPGFHGQETNDPLGSFSIQGGGWLSMRVLIRNLQQWFADRNLLLESEFAYEDLDLRSRPGAAHWQGEAYSRVVFCEGYRGANNPWFNWLDYRLSRGEILDAQSDSLLPECILNSGNWILPTSRNTARFGATYQWESLEAGTTTSGLAELLRGAGKIYRGKFTIQDHRAGIRPGTNDSRPYLGLHPMEPRLGILNGLGSKGSLVAPGAVRALADHILDDTPLDPEWDLQRRLKFLEKPLALP